MPRALGTALPFAKAELWRLARVLHSWEGDLVLGVLEARPTARQPARRPHSNPAGGGGSAARGLAPGHLRLCALWRSGFQTCGSASFLAPFGRHISLQQQRSGFKAGKKRGRGCPRNSQVTGGSSRLRGQDLTVFLFRALVCPFHRLTSPGLTRPRTRSPSEGGCPCPKGGLGCTGFLNLSVVEALYVDLHPSQTNLRV